MKKISIVFISIFLILNVGCQDNVNVKPEVEAIDIDVNIVRFDSIFYGAHPEDLQTLKKEFPFMFDATIPDSLWILKMNDTLQNYIESEVQKEFKDFKEQEAQIELFFKHLKYFFPKQSLPKVITLAEYVDYNTKVLLNEDLLFISLDNYLGKDHEFYEGFQDYIAQLQSPEQILPDIAHQYANQLVPLPESRDFLSQMVYEGKKLYFKQQTLPMLRPEYLIGYTEEQLAWADEYEFMIWQFFVERDLLYSTDSDLKRRFILPAPFTKFYLEIDSESPPRLGQFLGWEIVRAYAEKFPEKSLKEIVQLNEQDIFNQSKYKP